MELEMEYADIVIYALIGIIIIFLISRKSKKYKKGVIVANSKYAKKTKYYKYLLLKHKVYKVLVTVLTIIIIMSCALLVARTKMVFKRGIKNNVLIYIEDAVHNSRSLSSGSMWFGPLLVDFRAFLSSPIESTEVVECTGERKEDVQCEYPKNKTLNGDKLEKVRTIVDNIKGENISVVYRNNSSISFSNLSVARFMKIINSGFPVVLSSFTDNYIYTNQILDGISGIADSTDDDLFFHRYIPHNYITMNLQYFGGILTFSQKLSGFPTGLLREDAIFALYFLTPNLGPNSEYQKRNLNYLVNLYTSDEYSNKLSYLDFINERFEKYSNNEEGNKYVIWYTDKNKESETTSDILNRVKDYCDENKIKVLSIDTMSEDEIINTIKSSRKETIEKKDASDILMILITISSIILLVLAWRIRI